MYSSLSLRKWNFIRLCETFSLFTALNLSGSTSYCLLSRLIFLNVRCFDKLPEFNLPNTETTQAH